MEQLKRNQPIYRRPQPAQVSQEDRLLREFMAKQTPVDIMLLTGTEFPDVVITHISKFSIEVQLLSGSNDPARSFLYKHAIASIERAIKE